MDTSKAPSSGYRNLIKTSTEAKEVRLRARAKEASAIATLLRCTENGHPSRERLTDRLGALDAELLSASHVPSTDDPTELSDIAGASDILAFCESFETGLSSGKKRFKLQDVVADSLSNTAVDTRHQDAKDIERDCIIIGEQSQTVLYGSSLGYDGVVKAVAAEVAECCGERSDLAPIQRFSRALLNAVNRTTSGGDAYETIERFFKPAHLVFVAPDSSSPLEPLRIFCNIDAFHTKNGWDWGIKATTKAVSRYFIYEIDDVDRLRPIAKIEGTCVRCFGLSLPLPNYYDSRVADDNGKSLIARDYFEAIQSSVVEIAGNLLS